MAPNNKQLPEIPLQELPSWFNDELFNDCLKSEYSDCKNLITKITSVRLGVPPGENYSSTIYRIKVEVSDGSKCETRGFIIKRMIKQLQETFGSDALFRKEASVYTDILPQFVKYYDSIGEKIEFGPKLYKVLYEPDQIYLFEDLNERNYFCTNRYIGLNLTQMEVFYKKLAKFHAASLIHHEKHGNYDSEYFAHIATKPQGDVLKNMIDGMFPYFLEALQKNELLCHLYDKVKSWIPNYFNELARIVTPDPDAFNVLCHGDVWSNNFLFSSDKNQNPIDVLFIDYQITYWGSPAYDLYYTFTLSTQPEVKKYEFDHLISVYHAELVSSLGKLKYFGKIPTLRELHIDLLNKGFISAIWAIMLPLMTMEGSENSNFDNLTTQSEAGNNFKKSLYQSPKYCEHLDTLYKFLENRGLLDIVCK